ncbi:DUF721 domain-containing protein [candidate division KSB1 bacterium]
MSKRESQPKHVGTLISSVLAELGLTGTYKQHKALLLWPEAAGDIIANVTEPDRIEYGRLYVRVRNSSWRQEIHYYKSDILKRLNEMLDEEVVKEIILI